VIVIKTEISEIQEIFSERMQKKTQKATYIIIVSFFFTGRPGVAGR
jgi:hypothetical protein